MLPRAHLPGQCASVREAATIGELGCLLSFTGVVGRVLAERGLLPESLALEIMESVLHEDPMSAIVTLGTLKIGSSFIRSFHDVEGREIVRAVIALAQTLNLREVAEGVEDSRQLM